MKIYVLCKYLKLISVGGFLRVFMYVNTGHFKVQTALHGGRLDSGRCYYSFLEVGIYILFQCVAFNIRFLLAVFKERDAKF